MGAIIQDFRQVIVLATISRTVIRMVVMVLIHDANILGSITVAAVRAILGIIVGIPQISETPDRESVRFLEINEYLARI